MLILTPLGAGGMGGIDRLMDEIRRRCGVAAPDLDLKFLTTRGPGSLLLSPFYCAAAALALIGYRLARGRSVCHVNLASKGYTRILDGAHSSFINPTVNLAATTEMQTEVAVFVGGNALAGIPGMGQVILIQNPAIVETN